MVKIYGIPNCDTVQKAIKWIKANNLEYEFHDFKKDGITKKKIENWLKIVPIEKLMNKASNPYKELPSDAKPTTAEEMIKLMISQPTSIKRPVLEFEKGVLVGFKEEEYIEKIVKA
jgi:arsenate reductase (glutaredoxin)